MESGSIADGQITASSYGNNRVPSRARLNRTSSGWAPVHTDSSPWLQVDLLSYHTSVSRVATQGNNLVQQWVTSYFLQHSNDGATFHYYIELAKSTGKVRQNKCLNVLLRCSDIKQSVDSNFAIVGFT